MDWAIRKGVDGVITDDPMTFLQIRRRYEHGEVPRREDMGGDGTPATPGDTEPPRHVVAPLTTSWSRWAKLYLRVVTIQLLITVLMPFLLRTKRFN